VDDGAGGRLPQPVAHLIVVGLDLVRLGDMGVIAQAVEQLGPVGLWVDWLELNALVKRLLLGAFGLGFDVQAAHSLPHTGHSAQGAQVGQGIHIHRMGFGVNVFGKVTHGLAPSY